jgi:hypothetical protein
MTRKFDLNIEKVLEHWDLQHAIREIIANAIDEQQLTKTKSIDIFKDKNENWHIKDYGRGIKYNHLTQNENDEKIKNPDKVIGKFGVGLKDALATFSRKKIKITIISKFGKITTDKYCKDGFNDLKTLHALIDDTENNEFIGTEVILEGLNDKYIKEAKSFFLMFSNNDLLESTEFGSVYKKEKIAKIYISGLLVAEEENFLFSYNITSMTKIMKKALNRERTNVGRAAYTPRIKDILKKCISEQIANLLTQDLSKYDSGKHHDEINWIDISIHACKLLNSLKKVVFVTSTEMYSSRDIIDSLKADGYSPIIIPDTVKYKIHGIKDYNENPMKDIEQYTKEWNDSFKFKFINEKQLNKLEKEIFSKTNSIFNLIGGKPRIIKNIFISETMRLENTGFAAVGIWDPTNNQIVIKRDQLKSLKLYAGTLLHEVAHAISGASDVSREFESELSRIIGEIVSNKL